MHPAANAVHTWIMPLNLYACNYFFLHNYLSNCLSILAASAATLSSFWRATARFAFAALVGTPLLLECHCISLSRTACSSFALLHMVVLETWQAQTAATTLSTPLRYKQLLALRVVVQAPQQQKCQWSQPWRSPWWYLVVVTDMVVAVNPNMEVTAPVVFPRCLVSGI